MSDEQPRVAPGVADSQQDRPARDPKGRFAPGVSGNPAGKPPGSRDARTIAAEHEIALSVAKLGPKAANVLDELLDSPNESVRYAAARDIIGYLTREGARLRATATASRTAKQDRSLPLTVRLRAMLRRAEEMEAAEAAEARDNFTIDALPAPAVVEAEVVAPAPEPPAHDPADVLRFPITPIKEEA